MSDRIAIGFCLDYADCIWDPRGVVEKVLPESYYTRNIKAATHAVAWCLPLKIYYAPGYESEVVAFLKTLDEEESESPDNVWRIYRCKPGVTPELVCEHPGSFEEAERELRTEPD